jgi:hypothetical protein
MDEPQNRNNNNDGNGRPNEWYNDKFVVFCMLIGVVVVCAMVCGTVLYCVANILSATMGKENGPELKPEWIQELQAKIDENVSRAVMVF